MEFEKLHQHITYSYKVLIVTHPAPDQDAIGSSVALWKYLKEIGKEVLIFCRDEVPNYLKSLPWSAQLSHDQREMLNFEAELLLVVDMSDAARLREIGLPVSESKSLPTAVIDHHPYPTIKMNINLHDVKASSSAELITEYFKHIGYRPGPLVANALLAGILADTENMTNPATSAKTLTVAARLMRCGADFAKATKLWLTKDFVGLKIYGLALARLYFSDVYNVLVTVVRLADKVNLQQQQDALAGLSNYLKSAAQGQIILVLQERDDGFISGSLRSLNPKVNVAKLAGWLGGGGHVQAAGFKIKGQLKRLPGGQWQIV